ncbi:MAG: FeoA family protein [Planctomycetota bacterium]
MTILCPETRTLSIPLTMLAKGRSAVVEAIDDVDREDLRKLLALGILPGDPVTMIRLWPAVVFRVGGTEFALDRRLADRIRVREPEPRG